MFRLILDDSPIMASVIGIPGYEDRMRDWSEEGDQALRARAADIVDRAAADTEEDPVTRAVIVDQAHSLIATIDSRIVEHVVAEGFFGPVGSLFTMLPLIDAAPRLPKIPEYLRQVADRLRTEDRYPLSRHVATAVAHVERYLASPVAKWEESNSELVRAAFAEYRDVLRDEIAPHGRPDDEAGLCWLPDGERNYARLVERYTTTKHTPEQLHQIGLDLIAKLREEYVEIGSKVFGLDTVEEVFEKLRTDTSLRWPDEQSMIDAARLSITRAEEAAPQWFGRVPSTRCQVEFVPEAEQDIAPLAYYVDPAPDGSRPGTYFLNPKGATERHRSLSDAIAFHEAVPGHHFQIELSKELDLPDIRKYAFIDAYLEGWALYTERLADEMGLYTDDLARIGMLTQDAMRAGRLVVDTGIHAFGWSRQRAIDFLLENTVMSPVEVEAEIDRYIEVPGQALAYMVGRLEIQRLRDQASATMGDRFDIREFHDLVIGGGPLPLAVLADVVTAWSSPAPSSSSST
ncbi:DUF885 domain-containing protein [Lentzea tibetensis]|uniref:DUF885 domain-containing protein n=2 Tax=Lentzea tibetensis TaxID=2591470 RepID=A0A563EGE7_9PSEU|nr:DUF885 domain-containing protein [Lentzea tibetensis]